MIESFPCPKCGAKLVRSGKLTIGDTMVPVFQCDKCTVPWEFDGTTEDVAYTFAVSPKGTAFDPATESLPP
jgi:transcription elongation factor Elf1